MGPENRTSHPGTSHNLAYLPDSDLDPGNRRQWLSTRRLEARMVLSILRETLEPEECQTHFRLHNLLDICVGALGTVKGVVKEPLPSGETGSAIEMVDDIFWVAAGYEDAGASRQSSLRIISAVLDGVIVGSGNVVVERAKVSLLSGSYQRRTRGNDLADDYCKFGRSRWEIIH
ncbi:hypothetical protein DOTSEDRAFT_39028 [Dothistroma septosporum NZE10]|uniref:Uncharacterized protein n=1 Tax=Dothistroma septosporum (strain NZE10 / CBS 128990) TaxID=675120 RepID=M2WIN6_DOTSN|nr:hypothetical protein DOTSEDRAFT_39028 [Dothistroma septosporum NZE10]